MVLWFFFNVKEMVESTKPIVNNRQKRPVFGDMRFLGLDKKKWHSKMDLLWHCVSSDLFTQLYVLISAGLYFNKRQQK